MLSEAFLKAKTCYLNCFPNAKWSKEARSDLGNASKCINSRRKPAHSAANLAKRLKTATITSGKGPGKVFGQCDQKSRKPFDDERLRKNRV